MVKEIRTELCWTTVSCPLHSMIVMMHRCRHFGGDAAYRASAPECRHGWSFRPHLRVFLWQKVLGVAKMSLADL
jgi:hypothetical protein